MSVFLHRLTPVESLPATLSPGSYLLEAEGVTLQVWLKEPLESSRLAGLIRSALRE